MLILKSKNTILSIFLFCITVYPKTLKIGNNEEIKSIKKGIEKCDTGDTLKIFGGYYFEGNLILSKSITIIGINYPIISGNNKDQILLVKANNVVIKGIHFKDAGLSFVKDNAAVKLDSVVNCTIEKNKFTNNFFGIYLRQSQNCIVRNNEMVSNSKQQTYSGNGIHLWYCKKINIEGNTIQGHRDGIYLEFVKDGVIKNNICKKNLRYGLHFMFSDSCIYMQNKFEKNTAGVAVMYSHFIEMIENSFSNNWGTATYGLLLKEISDGKIINNSFNKNTCGIYLEGSNRNRIHKNSFTNNGWAIRLMANSMDNKFEKNNFIGNTFEVTTNSTRNFNYFDNNYWSDYSGYDLNNDGIGDIPHHPVKLFSLLVEKNPSIIIFLHSFFVDLINSAERVFPVLIPETLIDNNPRIKIIK